MGWTRYCDQSKLISVCVESAVQKVISNELTHYMLTLFVVGM